MEYLGKKKCQVLKDFRQQIADANGIQYAPCECHHEGDCAGTCPRCEQEVRYIESELAKKQKMGKKIAIAAAISAAIMSTASLSSCNSCVRGIETQGVPTTTPTTQAEIDSLDDVDGVILEGEAEADTTNLMNVMPPYDDSTKVEPKKCK